MTRSVHQPFVPTQLRAARQQRREFPRLSPFLSEALSLFFSIHATLHEQPKYEPEQWEGQMYAAGMNTRGKVIWQRLEPH